MVEFTALDSSHINGAHYAEETKTLTIEFAGGKTYQYSGVDQDEYDSFMAAPSAGSYFHQYIKGQYPTKRV